MMWYTVSKINDACLNWAKTVFQSVADLISSNPPVWTDANETSFIIPRSVTLCRSQISVSSPCAFAVAGERMFRSKFYFCVCVEGFDSHSSKTIWKWRTELWIMEECEKKNPADNKKTASSSIAATAAELNGLHKLLRSKRKQTHS